MNLVSTSGPVRVVETVQLACEEAEVSLNGSVGEDGIHQRKASGSFYTPMDVSDFFWREFFAFHGLENRDTARTFIQTHSFVEPAVGAGILVFALIKKLLEVGCEAADLNMLSIQVYDINQDALAFVEQKIAEVKTQLGCDFDFTSVHQDFLKSDKAVSESARSIVYFGNPPFVQNPKHAKWRNSYADFLEACYDADARAAVSFILPLSLSFSREYKDMRSKLKETNAHIQIASFDNIPDCLFKFGKPGHLNTNTANSQRCSIIHLKHGEAFQIEASPLIRWKAKERGQVLGSVAEHANATHYAFDDQFLRPAHGLILPYMEQETAYSLKDLVKPQGNYSLHVAGVARNYIGLRDHAGSGTHQFFFTTHADFVKFLTIMASDVFLDYWLSVGDGFHVTKGNILNFPVSHALAASMEDFRKTMVTLWENKKMFSKMKRNAGQTQTSYDFSGQVLLWEKITPHKVRKAA